jgi:hypothetical protein
MRAPSPATRHHPMRNTEELHLSLEEIAGRLKGAQARAHAAGLEALTAMFEVAHWLHQAKAVLRVVDRSKGAFGRWCAAHWPISKGHRSRVMALYANKDHFYLAKSYFEGRGRSLTAHEFTIQGALRLVREWLILTTPEADTSVKNYAEKKRYGKAAVEAARAEGVAENRRLLAELDKAKRTIKELRGKLLAATTSKTRKAA